LLEGIVTKGIGGFYYVNCNEILYECKPKGTFRLEKNSPYPGDYVSVEVSDSEFQKGTIVGIKKRKNFLKRPAVANIDQLFIVISSNNPAPDLLLADKLIIAAINSGIRPVILINKIDLRTSDEKKIEEQYINTGFDIHITSTISGEGINEIFSLMQGKLNAFAGQSGVGKSSILNALMQSNSMIIGELGDRSQRGKHTTRHTEIFPLKNGGFLLDTPGFSSYEIHDVNEAELSNYFPEMNQFSHKCRFNGCLHYLEPKCAVKEGVELGEINSERYKRYLTILATIRDNISNKWR